MDQGYPNEERISLPHHQTGRLRELPIIRIVLGLLVLMFGVAGVIKWLMPPPVPLPTPPPARITYPTGVVVVTGIQRIGRLESVSDTFQQIVQYEATGGNWFTKIFNDPKKLFVVYGNVVAGVDLATITSSDVKIQRQDNTHASVVLTLPAPQIFSATLDNSKTQVYDISGGLFRAFNQGMDPATENQVIAGAQGTLRSEACQAKILPQASDSTQVQLTSFLTTLGFTSVTVTVAAPGKCG